MIFIFFHRFWSRYLKHRNTNQQSILKTFYNLVGTRNRRNIFRIRKTLSNYWCTCFILAFAKSWCIMNLVNYLLNTLQNNFYWVEVNYDERGKHNTNSQTKIKVTTLKLNLSGYKYISVCVRGIMRLLQIMLVKVLPLCWNCFPSTGCLIKLNLA